MSQHYSNPRREDDCEDSPRMCALCGLPMSLMDHDPNAEEGDDLGAHYVCDGPNDNTARRGCWSVEQAERD